MSLILSSCPTLGLWQVVRLEFIKTRKDPNYKQSTAVAVALAVRQNLQGLDMER